METIFSPIFGSFPQLKLGATFSDARKDQSNSCVQQHCRDPCSEVFELCAWREVKRTGPPGSDACKLPAQGGPCAFIRHQAGSTLPVSCHCPALLGQTQEIFSRFRSGQISFFLAHSFERNGITFSGLFVLWRPKVFVEFCSYWQPRIQMLVKQTSGANFPPLSVFLSHLRLTPLPFFRCLWCKNHCPAPGQPAPCTIACECQKLKTTSWLCQHTFFGSFPRRGPLHELTFWVFETQNEFGSYLTDGMFSESQIHTRF